MIDPPHSGWRHEIEQLAGDRQHGAAEIVRRATSILIEAFDSDELLNDLQPLRESLHRLRFGHASMAPVLRLTARLWQFLDKQFQSSSQQGEAAHDFREQWVDLLTGLGHEQDRAEQALLKNLRSSFRPETGIALYSSSSTVRNGLEALAGELREIPVYVGLSVPGKEGETAAENLVDFGYNPVLVTDAHLADLLIQGKAGTLILGCDAFDARRFINKIGSGALAALAIEGGSSAELWTTGTKYLKSIDDLDTDVHAHSDLDDADEQLKFPRPLFGTGSLEDITCIRCEQGCIEPGIRDLSTIFDDVTIPDRLKLRS